MIASASDRPPGFVLLSTYVRAAATLFTDNEQRAIELLLIGDPKAGKVIRGTGGVRKLRVSLRHRGKRGGARVIYYYRRNVGRIYLMMAYDKARREDITPDQRKELRRLTLLLEQEP